MSMLPIYISNIADEYFNKIDDVSVNRITDDLHDEEDWTRETKDLIEEAIYKGIEEYKKNAGMGL